jgi:hypothetical protein
VLFLRAFFDLGDVVGTGMQHEMAEFVGGAENAPFHRNSLPYVHYHRRAAVLLSDRQAEETIGSHGNRENLYTGVFEQAADVMDGFGWFQPQLFPAEPGRLGGAVAGALLPDSFKAERYLFVQTLFEEVEIIEPARHFGQDILAILHPLRRTEPDCAQFPNRLETIARSEGTRLGNINATMQLSRYL